MDLSLLQMAENSETIYEDAPALKDIRERNGQLYVQVEWEGLPDVIDMM